MSDLERAYTALSGKLSAYTGLWQYYEGTHPLRYSTERLRDIFKDINARFSQNWCAVVVDSVLERLNLKGFDVQDVGANSALDEMWAAQRLQLDAYDAHTAALVCNESYAIAWPDASGNPQVYYNDPRLCHMFYQAENPKAKDFAAKWWTGPDERRYLTLYYPDRLEYYASTGKSENVSSASSFRPLEPPNASNPYGEIPVFHFRRSRTGQTGELGNVITLQDAINKLLADMMVAAEFGAFRQRYIISNADNANIKNTPNAVWMLGSGADGQQPTQVGDFDVTPLANYLDAIDKLAGSIAIITRTPKHYFYSAGAGVSGDALLAMEAPLVHKAEQYRERFSVTWQEMGAFLLKLRGITANPADLVPVWADARTVQPIAEATARELSVRAGIPLETQLRREGWGQDEIDQMAKDQQAVSAAQQSSLAAAMLEAQRRFDGGQQQGDGQAVTNA